MSKINKINVGVDVGHQLRISVTVDGVEVNLDVNPFFLFEVENEGSIEIFNSSTQNSLSSGVVVVQNEDFVFWTVPNNEEYLNLADKFFKFDKKEYFEAFQKAMFDLVKKTSVLSGFDRRKVSVGEDNLRDFLQNNKEKFLKTLELVAWFQIVNI